MIKKFLLFVGLGCGLSIASFAQSQSSHTIQTGETLSILAKKYGTTVGDIMRLNGMNSNSKLSVGETIKIPAAGKKVVAATSTETSAVSSDANAGKTHTVEVGESLYKISREYGVSVDRLKSYNGLTDNNIKVGQVLQLSNTPAAAIGGVPTSVQKDPVQATATDNQLHSSTITTKALGDEDASTSSPVTKTISSSSSFFANAFGKDVDGRSLKTVNGTTGIFKTESGWNDQKYYAMMNSAAPGSIVKITYGEKIIYAKVLWNLNDIKDNKGLDFRISDAAATALGIDGRTAKVDVAYYY